MHGADFGDSNIRHLRALPQQTNYRMDGDDIYYSFKCAGEMVEVKHPELDILDAIDILAEKGMTTITTDNAREFIQGFLDVHKANFT